MIAPARVWDEAAVGAVVATGDAVAPADPAGDPVAAIDAVGIAEGDEVSGVASEVGASTEGWAYG